MDGHACRAIEREPHTRARIVVADEHAIFRSGLRRLLETQPGLQIVGEAGDKAKIVPLVTELDPDIVLIGLSRSGGGSLEVVQEIAALGLRARPILLTVSMDTESVNAALRMGARAVVPKESPADVLFESIACVMDGHYCIGRERVSDIAASIRRFATARRQDKAFGLTSRELEILEAVVLGDTNKAIALRLTISENTVKRHLMHIFDKVGASNRVELAMFAAYHGLTGV